MKRWKVISIILVSCAFIATNLYLIMKEDSKVLRSVFVKEWTKVKQDTVTETFETKGFTTSAEEYEVYFDDGDKDFQRFLVKEGAEITVGTPLYEYRVKDIERKIENAKQDVMEIEGQITSVTEYIKKLTDYKAKVPSASTASGVLNQNIKPNASDDLINSTLEQEIYSQELEKSKLEKEKTKLASQLTEFNKQSGVLTFNSVVAGVVKKVDDTLGNPVMMIASTQQAIDGVLSEAELRKTEIGMRVEIDSPLLDKKINGTVGRVDKYPTKEPSLDQASVFPFQVIMDTMETPTTPLVIGSKVDVTVITNEAIDVPTVPSQTVHNSEHKPYLFKLTKKGYVNKEYMTAGVSANKKVQIIEGSTEGDVVLVSPNQIPKNHSTFITPIQTDQVTFTTYKRLTTREKLNYFLIGLLEK